MGSVLCRTLHAVDFWIWGAQTIARRGCRTASVWCCVAAVWTSFGFGVRQCALPPALRTAAYKTDQNILYNSAEFKTLLFNVRNHSRIYHWQFPSMANYNRLGSAFASVWLIVFLDIQSCSFTLFCPIFMAQWQVLGSCNIPGPFEAMEWKLWFWTSFLTVLQMALSCTFFALLFCMSRII